MIKKLFILLTLLAASVSMASENVFSVRDEETMLNGQAIKIIGLRCSNALISDGTTQRLIDNLDSFKSYGVNTVSVFFMGSRFGDVKGYRVDSTLDSVYAGRMGRIIEAADERGMIVLVGCLYWSTSRAKEDIDGVWGQADANKAIANTVRWLSEHNYRNVFVDVDNEGMAHDATGWSIASMIDAAHAVDPSIMIAYNDGDSPPANADLYIHHSPKVAGKPWLDSESTPKNFSYWGDYSKKRHRETEGDYYNYSRIGRYTAEMKEAQLAQTREGIENHNGIMLASTWLQCAPGEGVGGPFMKAGGRSNIDDVDKDIDTLHPDAGIGWWLEYVRDRYGPESTKAASGNRLTVRGERFFLNGKPFDMWGVRVASGSQNEELTDSLIANLDDYKAHGVNSITVFVQGSSGGFSDPFSPNGKSIEAGHLRRIKRIIEACDKREMVAIVGIFYQRTMANMDNVRRLETGEAITEAVKTVTGELKGFGNIIINIANEQNTSGYRNMHNGAIRLYDFTDPERIVKLCRMVHEIDEDRLVGGGGYMDGKNIGIGRSPDVDVLLFDTFGKDIENDQDSGWHYDHFLKNGVVGKPMVNVEIFGAWTRKFVTETGEGGRYPPAGREKHFQEIDGARERPGLSVFLHAKTWFQGPSLELPVRFDLGGAGTDEDPGVRWYFEYVRDNRMR